MAMFVYEDGTVTGSVDVVELDAIQKAMKSAGKKRLADVSWPIESAAQLADQISAQAEADAKAAKTTTKKEN